MKKIQALFNYQQDGENKQQVLTCDVLLIENLQKLKEEIERELKDRGFENVRVSIITLMEDNKTYIFP